MGQDPPTTKFVTMNMPILFYNFHKLNLEKEVHKLRLYFQEFTPKNIYVIL